MSDKNIYTKVSLNIMMVFSIAILGTFIPESFPDFFGDWNCQGGQWEGVVFESHWIGCSYGDRHTNASTHYGFRHWLWACMSISLFIAQVVRVIFIIDKSQES
jgi:hypothetical protein